MDVDAFLAAAKRQAKGADVLRRNLVVPNDVRVVNVHRYAWDAYEAFVRRFYSDGRPRIVALSMNPGPFGAVQTGIPFCDTAMARSLLPGFDRLVRKRPRWVRSERSEVSALKLVEWSKRFGGIEGLYQRIVLAMTCPLGILKGEAKLNVPLPALPRSEQRKIESFIRIHAPHEIRACHPTGILVLGEWAHHTWRLLGDGNPDLATLPVAVVPHPAAHITNEAKYAAWSRGFDALWAQGTPPPGPGPL